MIRLLRAWIPTLLWIAVIASESGFGSSSNTGRILRPVLLFLFPHMTAAQFGVIHAFIRKSGHFLGYAMLSFLAYRSWWATLRQRSDGGWPTQASSAWVGYTWRNIFGRWAWRAAVLALLTTVAVAGADEFHQSFDPRRTGTIADVALDGMGGVLVQAILIAISAGSLTKRPRPPAVDAETITSS